ncbi:MAG: FlgO family outer membrane protein [Cyclobacteriaceae bacterium]|jgi:TolB-like protein|nr:FlgO family outer membrane protein [Cyclobacteriaceae bacterium]
MASIIPGFEYDIFISYRHNDNRSGWVTEFVNSLREELAATIKDPISIYFDQNPHDGLLETHNVDKSLEGKLKCLIFIPIISQTYCDPKSFAWQHEFISFNKLAKEDSLGRDIKLSNGNVTSRILPIKIHDLDADDKASIENEIGGVLRAIEFIYKSGGVNRPLNSKDDEVRTSGKILYRDQINKVANAIKEIINSLKNPIARTTPTTNNHPLITKDSRTRKAVIISMVMLLFALFGYFFYQQFTTTHEQPSTLEKSIAVLPFVDLSEQKDQGWFGDGLTEEILNSLTHIKGLKVTSRTSSFAFKDKNLRIQLIADSLGVNYVVEGSIRKSDNGLRITAQLIRAKDDFHIWSNTYDRKAEDIFVLQREIATKIAESLNVSLDETAMKQMQWAGTTNAEAYLAFLKGRELDNQAHERNRFVDLAKLKKANFYYKQSSQYDPDFVNPYLFHADFFLHYVLNDDPEYQDTLTNEQAYKLFNDDLANAIARSKETSQADYYRISQTMYSTNWTNFRQIIEKSLANKDAPRHFKYQNFDLSTLLIALGYGEQLSKISEEILLQDPTASEAGRSIIFNLMYAGKYQEALTKIETLDQSAVRYGINDYKLYIMIQQGKLDEAYDLIIQDPIQDYFPYYDLKSIILAKQGKQNEAAQILKMTHRSSPFYLFAVEEVLGRQAANKEAALMDKKILLDFPLFRSLFLSPNKLPYDLSETPNFARRLKQAGVDVSRHN